MFFKFFSNNIVEKLFIFLLIGGLAVVITNFSFLMSKNKPRSDELIPPPCRNDLGYFFVPSNSESKTTAIKTGSGQAINQYFNANIGSQRSAYVYENDEIWTVNSETNRIIISSTLSLNVIDIINLATINCYQPTFIAYDSKATKKAGQIWISCTNSSRISVFDPKSYSQIGSLPTPPNITGSNSVGQIALGTGYAFVVYGSNRWVSYSTTYPDFKLLSDGYTPGNPIDQMVNIWKSNFPSSNQNALYILTSQNRIYKSLWNGLFIIDDISDAPTPVVTLNAITTSPDERFIYAIANNNDGLWVYYTNNMSEVAGSGNAISLQLTYPASLAVGLYNDEWQLLVTENQNTGSISALIDINSKTGLPYSPNIFSYIETGNNCNNVIYYEQQCACEFC